MKKPLFLAVCLLLVFAAVCAGADPAEDITDACETYVLNLNGKLLNLRDRNAQTYSLTTAYRDPQVYITPPEGQTVGAVFIAFGHTPMPFEVQRKEAGKWVTVTRSNEGFQQLYAEFEPIGDQLRLHFDSGGVARTLNIRELYIFTPGERSPIAAQWQPTVEKADILFAVTHPDDELLWFGGAIPTYAGQRRAATAVAYATCRYPYRMIELLSGLWHCGVRTYPVVGDFEDFSASSLREVHWNWGKKAIRTFWVRQLRRLRPEVVVTQDERGEYGHYNHIAMVQAMLKAVPLAADPDYDPESAEKWGVWQVKKLYVHLGEAPTTVMDWRRPLSAFGGKTGIEVAREAFLFHQSQNHKKYSVADVGDPYDSALYTLAFSTVGPDEAGNDFFEHIPAECLQALPAAARE